MSATVSEVPSDEREVLPKPIPTLREHPVLKLYEIVPERDEFWSSTLGLQQFCLPTPHRNVDGHRKSISFKSIDERFTSVNKHEKRFEVNTEKFSDDVEQQKSCRQRAVNYLLGWANLLQPLPEIPLNDKVQRVSLLIGCKSCGCTASTVYF